VIENDLPQGVLNEKKFKKVKSGLKMTAFIIWGLSITISGLFFVTYSNTQNSIRNDAQVAYDADVAANRSRIDLESKIDAEKRAVYQYYDLNSSFSPSNLGLDEYVRVDKEMDKIDAKYYVELEAIKAKVGPLIASNKTNDPTVGVKDVNWRLMFDDRAMGNSAMLAGIIVPLILGGMPGLMLFVIAHQREIAAYGMQGALPVASESVGKMVKSLDDNGTLDILAETGAKMMGKQADAQVKYGVPEKRAKLEKADVEAMNQTGATEAVAGQKEVYAEKTAKGIKKGLFK